MVKIKTIYEDGKLKILKQNDSYKVGNESKKFYSKASKLVEKTN